MQHVAIQGPVVPDRVIDVLDAIGWTPLASVLIPSRRAAAKLAPAPGSVPPGRRRA